MEGGYKLERTIGEVAKRHGLPTHVLRHWEDAGALRPGRTASGHRRYDAEHDAQVELIKCGKTAGLSLEPIAVVLHGSPLDRTPLLRRRLSELEREALELEAAKRLLGHVLNCETQESCTKCAHPQISFEFP